MIWAQLGQDAIAWLREYLFNGGFLGHKTMARVGETTRVTAILPEPLEPGSIDFDRGARQLDRRNVNDMITGRLTELIGLERNGCILVEDLWHAKEYPCGQGALPWVTVRTDDREELYWIWDRRSSSFAADDALGAAAGRRFLAVVSSWDGNEPELCATIPDHYLTTVSLRARAVIVEIFDGESYMVAELGDKA